MTSQVSLTQSSKKYSNRRVSYFIVMIIALSSCYGKLNTATEMAQYIPSLGSMLLALSLIASGAVKHFHKSSVNSILAGSAITLLALIGSIYSQDIQSCIYSLVFFVTWVSLLVILQHYTMPQLLRSFAYGAVASVLIYLVASGFQIKGALAVTGNSMTTEDRATGPFLSNFNLIAHTMAAFTILTVLLAPSEKKMGKIIFYATAAFAFLIMLSTASRGGLVALICALTITFFITYRGSIKHILFFFASIFAAGIFVAIFESQYIDRFILIMDINSSHRGIDSGFSGRQQLWATVFSQFFTMNIPFFWGGGFRNAWLSNFVLAVDNGYIVTIAETGFISLVVICSRLGSILMKSGRRIGRTPNTMDMVIVGLVTFILIESIVARYFLAIGNPVSLIILFFIVSGSTGYMTTKRPTKKLKTYLSKPSTVLKGPLAT